MYNALKNKIDTLIFNTHISGSYEKISEVENEEEVYRHKNKLAVVVKDEEVGKRIYNIIKGLEKRGSIIETPNAKFRIFKYISDRENTVQVFYISFTLKDNFWEDLNDIQKLKELVSFVNAVKENGYIIDKSLFDYKKCDQIAALLSFFKPIEEGEEDENECIIEYIHYILSKGKDLNEFYQELEAQGLVDTDIFKYGISALEMFYKYFKTRRFKEDILTVLGAEEYDSKYSYFNLGCDKYWEKCEYLLFDENNFKSNSKIVTENDKYTTYKHNNINFFRIYHETSDKFTEFLNSICDGFESCKLLEKMGTFVYDLKFNIIGYKNENSKSGYELTAKKFLYQHEIIDYFRELVRFFNKFNSISEEINVQTVENDFDIEKTIFWNFNERVNPEFFINEAKDLYNLISLDKKELEIQVTKLFFKILLRYVKNKDTYNESWSENNFFEMPEIRYLNPILVREFINYFFKEEVDYNKASSELYRIIDDCKASISLKKFYYDSRFIYDPAKVSYLFDYEVEKEYGIQIKEENLGEVFETTNGSRIVTFPSNTKKVSDVEESENAIRNDIWKSFGNFSGNVNIAGIKQIIYKKSIRRGVYEFIGYVTEPIKGERLTDEFLVSLSNKDFLMVVAELFTKFDSYCIPLKTIYMDKKYKFYIDIHDNNCCVRQSECRGNRHKESENYVYWTINRLRFHPKCNLNTFIDFKKDNYAKDGVPSRGLLVRLANSYDTCCEEHGVYFDSINKMCPICLQTKYFVDESEMCDLLFEDEYAKHYGTNEVGYTLKVYKKSKVDLTSLEEKVEEMMTGIEKDPNAPITRYHQECFMPYKKAINSDNKFIGYVYKAVDFDKKNGDGSCVNLKDLENMSNLPRIKSLIRLIYQVNNIISQGKGFAQNPFDNIFLIKGYARQVQFVNIDFITNQSNSEDIFKWTYQYVRDVIALDDNIEIELDSFNNLDMVLERLTDLSKKLTKYCSLHNTYYENKFLFCPKCIPDAKIKNEEVVPVNPETIFKLKQINEGGESFIYDYDENSVVKVFKETEINVDLKNHIIVKLLSKKELLNKINEENKENGVKYRYIIPEKLFIDNTSNNVFAYLMEKVEGKPISSLRDKSQVKALGFTKKDVFEILITIGEGIETLHKKTNIYIGDLNGRNILFDANKNVYFLDFDGMGIDEIAPEFCTDGYIDPVSKKKNNITMKDDWYSFAVQAFYYLTYTHPFNGVYYVEEDGKKVALDIPDKMEKRISLLGNHGVDAPSVAEDWDWMFEGLKSFFLTTFEGNNRVSIVPLLKNQYYRLYGDISKVKKVKADMRVNPKFIATKLEIFNEEVTNVINHFSALCKNENGKYYLLVLGKDGKVVKVNLFNQYKNIIDVALSDDEKFVFVIFEDTIVVFDTESGTQISTTNISDPNNVVVNGSTLYFNYNNIIHELTFDSHKLVKEHKIDFLTEYETKRFYVQSNSKFVQVKRNSSEHADLIWCNSELFRALVYNSKPPEYYNILYDETTKLWLIVDSGGEVYCINSSNGSFEHVKFQNINDSNIENLTFNNGKLYIPEQDCLYIVSVNSKYATKKMECHTIMTPDSKVCSVNNDGFNVIANNGIYEVRRG